MGNQEMNLHNSIRDNFIVALVAYVKICEPKQIACDLNTISKYFSGRVSVPKELDEDIIKSTKKLISNLQSELNKYTITKQ